MAFCLEKGKDVEILIRDIKGIKKMERLDSELFNKVQNEAVAFPRRWMHYDLRT